VAAFTTGDPAQDIMRLASRSEVDLVLVPTPANLARNGVIEGVLDTLLRDALCDVAVLLAEEPGSAGDAPVLVPFGGGEHDWAALELGAWLAGGSGRPLHVLGTTAATDVGGRDASRLLADAGLLVQRTSGVTPVPRLVAPGHQGIVEIVEDGGLVVIGLTERWTEEGLGQTRWEIARTAAAPVLFVRRGLRPGGLAPDVSATRYGWSVAGQAAT
jgi:hypothetical protein